jgi:hypothetical protein
MDKVNIAIDQFENAVKARVIPQFVALESWQAFEQYNRFLDWKNKTLPELQLEAEKLYARKDQH